MKVPPFIATLLLLSWMGCSSGRPATQEPEAYAAAYLEDRIASRDAPGIQYVAVSAEKVLFDHAAGLADIERGIQLTSTTTMMGYSMTKTITAAAVLQLVGDGRCSLDDPVIRYLPSIPYGPSLTIRHLLAQTSGIPNPIPLRWAHLLSEHDGFSEDAYLGMILKENPDLDSEPGDGYAYSNISYWLLGTLIEAVSGQSYAEYVHARIFKPLGLTRHEADFVVPDRSHHAKGYLPRWTFLNLLKSFVMDTKFFGEYEDGWLHIEDHYLNGPAFGGMVGTARAFGLFLKDQLQDSSRLLDDRMSRAFFSQQESNDGETVPMTLGWHIGDVAGERYYFKEGGGGGFHAEMRIYPGSGIGTVVIANNTTFDAPGLLDDLDPVFLQMQKDRRKQ